MVPRVHHTEHIMDMFEPGKFGTAVAFKKRYGNFINGEWVAPAGGQYF
jgi:aldehyde dehydrogenase